MQPIVVFDTNVLLSALFSKNGAPARCGLLAKERQIKSITCHEILDEFQEKLLGKFRFSEEMATTAIDELKNCSQLVWHVLPLEQFQGIEIGQPSVFLERFVAQHPL